MASRATSASAQCEYVRDKLRKFEEAGADQIGLMGQLSNYKHEDICEAMELLGREVLPEFKEREAKRAREKAAIVEPMIETRHESQTRAEDSQARRPDDHQGRRRLLTRS